MVVGVARPGPQPSAPRADRFWARVDRSGDCWIWTGALAVARGGYGHFYDDDQRLRRAHRVAWEIVFGAIPDAMAVCHACDTPACVRPDHLFLGTQGANLADMRAKGRGYVPPAERGVQRYNARLTDAIVRWLRDEHASGRRTVELAAEIGVSVGCAAKAIQRQTWRHVD